jgi:hypothetical protein
MAQKKTPKDSLDISGSKLPGMDEWQAHDDLRTIGNAEAIKKDKNRLGAVKKLHSRLSGALGVRKRGK